MNENLHVYCPKCGSEVMLADENGKAITPKSGDFFLRLKDNDPEKVKKLKDVISAMYGDDVEVQNVSSAEEEHGAAPEEDEIEKSITEDGDINSKFLWRRWIMAQVLRHYKTYDGEENFHNYFIKNRSMRYVFKTCTAEAKALSKLSGLELSEREMFFNNNVFKEIIKDYFAQYRAEIDAQLEALDKTNREIVYKKGLKARLETTFVIGKKTYQECDIARIQADMKELEKAAMKITNYDDMARMFNVIYRKFPPFKGCKKSKAWMDAFKGAGSFYTLDNLLRWHGCTIRDEKTDKVYSGDSSLKYLRDITKKLDSDEYYKLYAIMKRVVEENKFDFNKRMREVHNEVA